MQPVQPLVSKSRGDRAVGAGTEDQGQLSLVPVPRRADVLQSHLLSLLSNPSVNVELKLIQ